MVAGEERKRAKFWALHPSGPHPSGPHPWGPHPSGPHPSGPHPSGPHLRVFVLPCFVFSSCCFFFFLKKKGQKTETPIWAKVGSAKVGQSRLAKVGWAKVGQIRMAKVGQMFLAKVGLAKVGIGQSRQIRVESASASSLATTMTSRCCLSSCLKVFFIAGKDGGGLGLRLSWRYRHLRQRLRLLSWDSEAPVTGCVWMRTLILLLLGRHGFVREGSRTGRGFVRHVQQCRFSRLFGRATLHLSSV